jgi:uncharacterized protein YlzI (FlbEa/FlbD family)
MSQVVRISDNAFEKVSNAQKPEEKWKEALDRVLGVDEGSEYVTEEQVEEIVERKIEEIKHRH